jgi:alkylation response protein AidB-like acyl-CoA dehydrogenase
MAGDFLAHQREFRLRVRSFVERQLTPRGGQWETDGCFPLAVVRQCARQQLISLDRERNAIAAEEIPRCESLGFALSVFVQANLVAPMLDELGTPGQKKRFLAPLLKGSQLGAVAVSEPSAGSDFAALETRAEKGRRGWRLNGNKTYITNAAIAQFIIVAARSEPGKGLDGISLFLVPVKNPGVSVRRLSMLGLRTSAAGAITLSNCEIPAGNLLGKPGQAFGYIQAGLNRERLFGGLACVAWAQHALDKTVRYVRGRKAFGSTLNRFQSVRHQIAEMHSRLAAARELNYSTFLRWMRGEPVTGEICTIKLFSYQVAQQVIADCLQLHGGLGYTDEHWCSRFYRDARALTIAAGTPEIMKEMIAAYLRL